MDCFQQTMSMIGKGYGLFSTMSMIGKGYVLFSTNNVYDR